MIKVFGPIYIDFDEDPHDSGRISEIFETNFNNNIWCDHGYAYSSSKQKLCTWVNEEIWETMKKLFSWCKANKKRPKNTVCKECTYVQKDINEIDDDFDSPLDNEPTFSASYFYEVHIFNVETIE